MQAEEVDLAGERSRLDFPTYRVEFWVQSSGWAPQLDAWRLTEVGDAMEVLGWAAERADGRLYEVFVEWQEIEGQQLDALIRIWGSSPIEASAVGTITFEKVD